MVLLLNLFPVIIILGSLGLAYRWYRYNKLNLRNGIGLMITVFLTIILLNAMTPSYMPKGTVAPLKNPGFNGTEAVIEDRNLKPDLSADERQQRFDEKFDATGRAVDGK